MVRRSDEAWLGEGASWQFLEDDSVDVIVADAVCCSFLRERSVEDELSVESVLLRKPAPKPE